MPPPRARSDLRGHLTVLVDAVRLIRCFGELSCSPHIRASQLSHDGLDALPAQVSDDAAGDSAQHPACSISERCLDPRADGLDVERKEEVMRLAVEAEPRIADFDFEETIAALPPRGYGDLSLMTGIPAPHGVPRTAPRRPSPAPPSKQNPASRRPKDKSPPKKKRRTLMPRKATGTVRVLLNDQGKRIKGR